MLLMSDVSLLARIEESWKITAVFSSAAIDSDFGFKHPRSFNDCFLSILFFRFFYTCHSVSLATSLYRIFDNARTRRLCFNVYDLHIYPAFRIISYLFGYRSGA